MMQGALGVRRSKKREHRPKNSKSLTSALRSQHKNMIGYRAVICQQLVIRINASQRSRLIMADGLQVFDNSFWNQGILRRLKLFLLERTFFQFSTFRKISDCRSFTYLRTVTGSTPHTVSTSMALNSEPSVNRALTWDFWITSRSLKAIYNWKHTERKIRSRWYLYLS